MKELKLTKYDCTFLLTNLFLYTANQFTTNLYHFPKTKSQLIQNVIVLFHLSLSSTSNCFTFYVWKKSKLGSAFKFISF